MTMADIVMINLKQCDVEQLLPVLQMIIKSLFNFQSLQADDNKNEDNTQEAVFIHHWVDCDPDEFKKQWNQMINTLNTATGRSKSYTACYHCM